MTVSSMIGNLENAIGIAEDIQDDLKTGFAGRQTQADAAESAQQIRLKLTLVVQELTDLQKRENLQ